MKAGNRKYFFIFFLIAASVCSCTRSVDIKPVDAVNKTDYSIPQTFAPNGNNSKNTFKMSGMNLQSANMIVFDRWGEKVFTTDDAINKGWDGSYNGQQQPSGKFAYFCVLQNIYGRRDTVTGFFNLVK